MPESSFSRWSDLDRPRLDAPSLGAVLTRDSRLWRSLEVVEEIGSTNAELIGRAADPSEGGAPEGTVLVAEHQVTGRGRLDRVWASPPRAGLTVSFLLRPEVPAARKGWLPLLTGVALAESVSEVTGVLPSLKWPNDLLAADGRKLAGILAETVTRPHPPAVVVGTGLNVSTTAEELPDTGTSLARITGGTVDRGTVLLAFLRAVEQRYRRWVDVLGDPVSSGLAQDYLAWSSTVGTEVAVALPDGSTLEGTAQAVDWDGRLVVATAEGTVELASGDVRHVRRV
ncbi:biotin--[acetyl-CoA-carboxylase] ligase [Blastococcus sp. CT_GayMR19]|uniref:biotin--[acetyl-CoA-carboxylase] ligase n=1 Tax=Blastococcus sp. CT_GayMR19 TaxID=2559608 RepID=UPI0010741FC9|nr:biotin--[acetyl-CoA-carboxylase] ligase [Blastococcus sp. CT_GayMR19]TFV76087.1 biotin--[acetyl-CoA-carboxylase] ligase [Blastococcus sp. CT_GayMR19]